MFTSTSARPCYLEQDHGLASLKDMDGGHRANGFVSRSMTMGYATSYNRNSLRNLSVSSPRSGRFYDARFEDHKPHFLEACFLCKKPLGDNRDIFMYRYDYVPSHIRITQLDCKNRIFTWFLQDPLEDLQCFWLKIENFWL